MLNGLLFVCSIGALSSVVSHLIVKKNRRSVCVFQLLVGRRTGEGRAGFLLDSSPSAAVAVEARARADADVEAVAL